MCIPIRVSNGTQIIKTTTLVHCGATRNFIDVSLLCLLELPLEKLPKPIIANNVKGTANAKETTQWKAHTDILFKERMETQTHGSQPWMKANHPRDALAEEMESHH